MTNVTETAVLIPRHSSEEAVNATAMTDLTIDFYTAALLMEDTLDRFTLSEPVSEASYT